MIATSQHTTLSIGQLHILEMMNRCRTEESLRQLKKLLFDFYSKEAVAEALGNNVQIAKTEEKHSEYYDRQELCRLAHISTCTLWRMESEGLIHKMKFGRRNLYDKEEIDALLASGKLAKYSR